MLGWGEGRQKNICKGERCVKKGQGQKMWHIRNLGGGGFKKWSGWGHGKQEALLILNIYEIWSITLSMTDFESYSKILLKPKTLLIIKTRRWKFLRLLFTPVQLYFDVIGYFGCLRVERSTLKLRYLTQL